MKLIKRIICLLLFLSIFENYCFAQAKVLSGKIYDIKNNKGIAGATMKLFSKNKEIAEASTDSAGKFLIETTEYGSLRFQVSHIGYKESVVKIYRLASDTNITIALAPKTYSLNEVSITSRKRYLNFDGEKMIADNGFFASRSTNGLEALQTLPGIVVNNGNINLNGQSDITILFNDKKVTLNAQQAVLMLKALQPDMIQKIEVLSAKTAKYDAQGGGGVINIVTKKPLSDRYYVYLTNTFIVDKYLRANQSVYTYYKNNKFSGYVILGLTHNRNYGKSNINSSFSNKDTLTGIVRTGKNDNKDLYLTSDLGLNYDINKKSFVGVFAVLNRDYYHSSYNSSSEATGSQPYNLDFINNHKSDGLLSTIDLTYQRTLDSSGSFMKLLIGRISGFSKDRSLLSYNYDDSLGDFNIDNKVPLRGHQWVASVDVSNLLFSKLKIDYGLKLTSSFLNTKISYDTIRNNIRISDLNDQYNLDYREEILAGYVEASIKLKKIYLRSGVRYENSLMRNYYLSRGGNFKRNFSNFFPSLTLSYNTNPVKSSLTINKSIHRPYFEYINTYKQIIDRYTYKEGNALLNPAYTWTIGLNNYLFNTAFFNFGYSYSKNNITSVIKPEVDSLIKIIQPNNALNQNIFYLTMGSYIKFTKIWDGQLNFTGNIIKNMIDPEFYSTSYDRKWNPFYRISFSSDLSITKHITLNNDFSYYSEQRSYQSRQKDHWQDDIGIKVNFKGNFKARLLIMDVFNSYRDLTSTYSKGFYSTSTYDRNSRKIALTISYFFGKLNSSVHQDKSLEKNLQRFQKDQASN